MKSLCLKRHLSAKSLEPDSLVRVNSNIQLSKLKLNPEIEHAYQLENPTSYQGNTFETYRLS